MCVYICVHIGMYGHAERTGNRIPDLKADVRLSQTLEHFFAPCLVLYLTSLPLGFGFRVQGLRSRFQCSGFQVQSSGFRGSEFRVSGFVFRVSGFRVSGFVFWVSCFGFCVSGFGFQVSGFGFVSRLHPHVADNPWLPVAKSTDRLCLGFRAWRIYSSQDQHDHTRRPPAGVVVLLGSRLSEDPRRGKGGGGRNEPHDPYLAS